jgi:hypothetical protein
MSANRDRDFERLYAGGKCINIRHFYSIGTYGGREVFAVGFCDHDNGYFTGTVSYDGEKFSPVMAGGYFDRSASKAQDE